MVPLLLDVVPRNNGTLLSRDDDSKEKCRSYVFSGVNRQVTTADGLGPRQLFSASSGLGDLRLESGLVCTMRGPVQAKVGSPRLVVFSQSPYLDDDDYGSRS